MAVWRHNIAIHDRITMSETILTFKLWFWIIICHTYAISKSTVAKEIISADTWCIDLISTSELNELNDIKKAYLLGSIVLNILNNKQKHAATKNGWM